MPCVCIVETVIPMIRTYSELSKLSTFEERFQYLKLGGSVGESTFGFDRYLNQIFYKSKLWKRIRDEVIFRDCGCDLGVNGREIFGSVIIHHMNPITIKDIEADSKFLTDPEYLITTIHSTHNAIHYSDEKLLMTGPIERTKNDICLWRRN